MYCLTMQNNHLNKIKSLGYIPVGLGNNIQSQEFITDDTKNNISKKNAFIEVLFTIGFGEIN